MSIESICYTGVGSNKSGNYTKKGFMELMNKTLRKECSSYIKSLKCKSCKEAIRMSKREIKKMKSSKNKTYRIQPKTQEKLAKQLTRCKKCKTTNTKKCTFDNYILYSGAEKGKCEIKTKTKQSLI